MNRIARSPGSDDPDRGTSRKDDVSYARGCRRAARAGVPTSPGPRRTPARGGGRALRAPPRDRSGGRAPACCRAAGRRARSKNPTSESRARRRSWCRGRGTESVRAVRSRVPPTQLVREAPLGSPVVPDVRMTVRPSRPGRGGRGPIALRATSSSMVSASGESASVHPTMRASMPASRITASNSASCTTSCTPSLRTTLPSWGAEKPVLRYTALPPTLASAPAASKKYRLLRHRTATVSPVPIPRAKSARASASVRASRVR